MLTEHVDVALSSITALAPYVIKMLTGLSVTERQSDPHISRLVHAQVSLGLHCTACAAQLLVHAKMRVREMQ